MPRGWPGRREGPFEASSRYLASSLNLLRYAGTLPWFGFYGAAFGAALGGLAGGGLGAEFFTSSLFTAFWFASSAFF